MTDSALIERITRSLAFMLRHQPETFDLELDAHGFADLEDVVQALNERLGEPVEEEDVRDAVGSGDRPRYEIREDRIRALYGHSIPVEPGPSSKPPEHLYVSVPARELERARRFGLRGGRRRFLHLAISAEDAAESGRRASRDYTVLLIHALDAWEEGISFYDRTALWLAEEVPTHLIEVEGNYHDGTEPMLRSHSDDRDRDRDGGGRERGDRRGGRSRRGRGRGRDRDFDRGPERDVRDRAPDRYEPAGTRGEASHAERAPMAMGGDDERESEKARESEREPVRDVQAHRPAPGEHGRRGDERGGREGGGGRGDRGGRGGRGGRDDRGHGERGSRGGRNDDRREWEGRGGGGGGRDRGRERGDGRGERRPERREEGHVGREGRPPEGRPAQDRGASTGPRSGFGAGLQDEEARAARSVREPRPPPPPPPPPPREERPAPVDRPEFGAGL